MVCASEQAVILDREIRDEAIAEFRKLKAYTVNDHEKALLEAYLFGVGAEQQGGRDCAGAHLNADIVGQSSVAIAEGATSRCPRTPRCSWSRSPRSVSTNR